MISLDSNTNPTKQTNNIIIFECNDFRLETDLLFLKRKKNDEVELYLHNDYTKNQAIAIFLDVKDSYCLKFK